MVRIRLRRTGKKGQPSYRVVVADIESPRDGRFIEIIGHYNPRTDPATVSIEADRALYWLSQGAQPSDPVTRLLRKAGILARFEAIKRGAPDPGPAVAEEAVSAATDTEMEVLAEAGTGGDALEMAEASATVEDQEEDQAEPEGESTAEAD